MGSARFSARGARSVRSLHVDVSLVVVLVRLHLPVVVAADVLLLSLFHFHHHHPLHPHPSGANPATKYSAPLIEVGTGCSGLTSSISNLI
jgi:hypothetical protein